MKNKNGIKRALSFLMLCFFFVAVSIGAYAQKTVSGEVKDEGGLPLPGVSVIIKGTTSGTVTGIDGDYSIPNVNDDAVLVFSFVGMESQEVAVGNQTTINVTMNTSTIGLEEVVAIGYGTQKKANLTGSVGVATAERLENRPITSAGQGLQGVIPNLNITIRNGDPTRTADFNVRGMESISGGSPLILIDGVPGNMDKLNPNDIESITVLKDAAAAAVYGARAAFGVILVETKRGKTGKMTVTLATEQSATKPIALVDPVTDPLTAALAWNEANNRTNGTDRFDEDYITGFQRWKDNPTFENEWGVYDGTLRRYGYTNYKDMTIDDFAWQQKYDMNISGATESASYYVSFGYIDKEGWANLPKDKDYMYKRYNVLMKADFKINDWLTMDEQVSWSAEHNDQPHFYNWDTNINSIARVNPNHLVTFPDLPYYLEPGDHDQYEQYIGMYFLSLNALPYWEDGGRDTETEQRLLMKQGVTLTPIEGLRIRGDFSYSTYHRERQDVASKIEGIQNTDLTNIQIGNGFSGTDFIYNYSNYDQYYVANVYGEYTVPGLTDHFVKAMVGYNQEWGRNTYVGARAYTLITPLITDLSATTGTQQTFGSRSHFTLRGLFYRLNYSYKDRYLIEANGRYDGTSRFPTDDRFGFFPSVSFGWRLSNEPFMESASNWLDNLKFRVSYGTLGNQLLVDSNNNPIYYPYISTMGTGTSPYMMSSAGRIPYVSAAGLVSPTLTWETVETRNIGFDITTLNQRFDLSFDYFIRDTKDMLMDVTLPSVLGTSAPQSNAADLRNTGWELAATWRDRIGQDWMYSVTLALSDSKSEITKYDNPSGDISDYYVGQQLGEIWGYVTEGIFQTDAEAEAHADQSQLGANWRAGDIKYMDLNGDGAVNAGSGTLDDPGDRKIIGYNRDRYQFGLNPDIQYKGWTLNLFFQGRLKRDYLPSNGNWNAFYPFNAGHIEKFYLTETWSEDNPNAYFAAPHISTNTKKNIQPQSRYVQDASYIRLKNITLSYYLPDNLVKKVGMSRAQVYLSGMNLWEATGMHKPLDPEQTATVTQEYYFDRVYTLGVKVSF
ncbi:SusC/RagA family TonB-linked outer membrane protein [Maribellus comscasis]|uniref:SusC/RagA family TonB-linked outer membrane protein n=1 Tax=Maribellus comscasis TaxID=2681766 RepID=A0A6I6JY10_9BACT|nr:TonB-dependent receptor [Maribellus comscasis]QGY42594.1 SusC/RagA family TonB-linked outer membrane protein [Maribellus comscasis]